MGKETQPSLAPPMARALSSRSYKPSDACRRPSESSVVSQTCLTLQFMRQLLRNLQGRVDLPAKALRPYTKHGGLNGDHDHRTKTGLQATLRQVFAAYPYEAAWADEEANQTPPFSYMTKAERDKLRSFFKPLLGERIADGKVRFTDFDTAWVDSRELDFAVKQQLSKSRTFLNRTSTWPVQLIKTLNPKQFYRFQAGLPSLRGTGSICNVSNGGGCHWVAILIHPATRTIEFFDPYGKPPAHYPDLKPEMKKLLSAWIQSQQSRKKEITWAVQSNSVIVQRGAVQCGMFALYYLINRAKHRSRKAVIRSLERLGDEGMEQWRSTVFRRPPPEYAAWRKHQEAHWKKPHVEHAVEKGTRGQSIVVLE